MTTTINNPPPTTKPTQALLSTQPKPSPDIVAHNPHNLDDKIITNPDPAIINPLKPGGLVITDPIEAFQPSKPNQVIITDPIEAFQPPNNTPGRGSVNDVPNQYELPVPTLATGTINLAATESWLRQQADLAAAGKEPAMTPPAGVDPQQYREFIDLWKRVGSSTNPLQIKIAEDYFKKQAIRMMGGSAPASAEDTKSLGFGQPGNILPGGGVTDPLAKNIGTNNPDQNPLSILGGDPRGDNGKL